MKRVVMATAAGAALAAVVGIGIAGAATGSGPGGAVADALASLVGNGTISQDQADKVAAAIESEREERVEQHQGKRADYREELDKVLQDTLGLTSEQVRQRVAGGESLGDIIGDKNDELAAALIELVEENLQEAVTAGRLTQAQADRLAAAAKARIDRVLADDSPWLEAEGLGALAMLSGGRGLGFGPGFGGPGHGRHHGHWFRDGSAAPSPTAPSSGSGSSTDGSTSSV